MKQTGVNHICRLSTSKEEEQVNLKDLKRKGFDRVLSEQVCRSTPPHMRSKKSCCHLEEEEDELASHVSFVELFECSTTWWLTSIGVCCAIMFGGGPVSMQFLSVCSAAGVSFVRTGVSL